MFGLKWVKKAPDNLNKVYRWVIAEVNSSQRPLLSIILSLNSRLELAVLDLSIVWSKNKAKKSLP